ncbi:MAG: chemotaxis protein [Hyphomicrobiaceae bacterium]|nr:chemotaxis protein [Hyphomicrobiaceae bacterium]
MADLPLDLIAEGIVAVLLVLTILYCMLLNGRLKRLRGDEEALRVTISELITATEIAERAISGLKQTAADCDSTIGQRLREAETLNQQISTHVATGHAIVQRLAKVSRAAGLGAGQAAASPAPVQPALAAEPAAAPAASAERFSGLAAALRTRQDAASVAAEPARPATARSGELDRAAQAIRNQIAARRQGVAGGAR